MKLKNKKTGEIVEVESCNSYTGTIGLFFAEGRECDRAYESLAELNSEWEDYEEPKTDALHASIMFLADAFENHPDEWNDPEAGIKFVEKLRAYERLKDKGFRFGGVSLVNQCIHYKLYTENDYLTAEEFKEASNEFYKDLNLLFSEEGE